MTKEKRVGIFVVLGLIVLGVAVFLIGQNRKFWQRKALYTASYSDVAGLRPGAPVRMGGLDVGNVERVYYKESVDDTRVYVELSVVLDQTNRIRRKVLEADGKTLKFKGTVAKVANKGLLGDKMIELTVADPRAPLLDQSEPLEAEDPLDLSSYIAKFDGISTKADAILTNLQAGTKGLADPQLTEDIKGSVASLHDILDGVAHKDSAAHRLLYDPAEAARIDRILANLDSSTAQLNGVLADTHDMTTHIKSGPGLAHSVLYDGDLAQNASGTLDEVHKDLAQIRTGNGLAHVLLYGDAEQQHLMTNVNAMSDDLRTIVSNLKAGKGTIGALLVDPSIYEDVKSIVGNVERNQVLRALVRYSIKQDEQQATVKVDPKP